MAQQVWLITGCTSGIGEALAKALLARGDRVIATARAPVDRIASLKQAGATTLELDVSASQETIAAVVKTAISVYGHIDVVVPNAGYFHGGFSEGLTLDSWEQQLSVNFFGVIKLITPLLPHMRKRKSGTIAFMNSVHSHISGPGCGLYAVSKHAATAYAQTLSLELGPFGIKIITFDLGFIQTPVLEVMTVQPTEIEDYAQAMEMQASITQSMIGNMPGDVGKCSEAIIDVTKSAKRAFTMVPIGEDALLTVREYASLLNESCDEWDNVARSVEREGPRKGFWEHAEHYCWLERPKQSQQEHQ